MHEFYKRKVLVFEGKVFPKSATYIIPILPRAVTAYNILIQEIVAIAVQIETFVLFLILIFNVLLYCAVALPSQYEQYMQKLVSTKSGSKIITVFMSHISD